MRDCCHLIHPPTAHAHERGGPRASVVAGVAAPLQAQPEPSGSDLLVAGALAWSVGLLLAGALVAAVAVNVPLTDLLAALAGA